MDATNKSPSDFSLEELKEKARALGLPTSGVKQQIISRLMKADPDGMWMKETTKETPVVEHGNNATNEDDETTSSASEVAMLRRERELLERENRLMQRELDFARRENQDLRETRARSSSMDSVTETRDVARMNIRFVADLLHHFDGNSENYEVWAKQVTSLRVTYKLTDDETRIMIGMRLKNRAFEWLHSKPEYVNMPVDDLLKELKKMFYQQQSRIAMRRQFEDRVWRKDETFTEYVHKKIIMGNRISIGDDELIDYVIEGIPDPALRDQAHIQRLKTMDNLLEAFEKVSLSGRQYSSNTRWKTDVKSHNAQKNERKDMKKEESKTVRCYNCGLQNHYSADCPVKHRGMKCFECREFGHVAAKCPKKNNTPKDSCNITVSMDGKCCKTVSVSDQNITALIDTGSDLSLLRADQYILLGSPKLSRKEIKFRGVGSSDNKTLGECCLNVKVDDEYYSLMVQVVSDTLMRCPLLIGTDFLNTIEMTVNAGIVSIRKPKEMDSEQHDIPEIYKIDCVSNGCEIDLSYINDSTNRAKVEALIGDYKPIKTREAGVTMKLVLKDEHPVYHRARRLSPTEKDKVNAHVNDWLRDGKIRPSLSEYASPVVLVGKKDGSTRLCVDYRALNNKIIKDRYPLPLIDDLLDSLQGASVYSTLDLKNGFFHVPLDKDSRKYTAFITPEGHYEFSYAPFGLCNSPAVFQRYINAVFRDLINRKIISVYMDDLIIPTTDCATGLKNLEIVLSVAREFGLEINWRKCFFLQTSIEFLGHIIGNGSIRPSERKTDAVIKFPQPTTIRQIQQFLGLTGYFRKFIPQYSMIARPLTDLLKSNVKFQFGEKEFFAFKQLKMLLSVKPVLKLYNVKAETELHTDASMFGYGAILLQRDCNDNMFHPIFYASGKTTSAESKYTSYELEVLAIIKALRKFRIYLLGIPFKIITDCQAFSMTMCKKDLCVRVARWALLLEEFQYTIEHRASKNMIHADALSRNPLPSSMLVDESDESMIARIRRAQSSDSDLKKIFLLTEKEGCDDYIVRNGLLYKNDSDDIRLVLPKLMQSQIIRRVHEKGHFSAKKTETLVKRDYWFPDIHSKVEKIINNCVNCILAERKRGKQDGYLNSIDKGNVPLETYHVDHLGPLPSTRKMYRHIFVVVDAFSKFTWLYATKSTSTTEVLDRLRKQAVVFGNPKRIISDRGTAFTSQEFKEYCETENIEHILVTTGVPRGNGQVERVNRTLIPILTKLSAPKQEEWHKYLSLSQQYLNTALSRSIGTTPFTLLFGTHMRLRDDVEIRELIEAEWANTYQENRDELRAQAKENIEKLQEENRKTYNKKRKPAREYREKDLVAIKRTQLGPGLKLAAKYFGPYEVVKKLRNDRYIVNKIGEHEGPQQTSTSADYMKAWIDNVSEESENSDGDESA